MNSYGVIQNIATPDVHNCGQFGWYFWRYDAPQLVEAEEGFEICITMGLVSHNIEE